jgi:glycogen synthase
MSEPTATATPTAEKRDVNNALLFECAWEVANKVGGIYTVIKTKVPVTVSEYGDRYCLVGPLSYKTAPMEVEQQEPSDPHFAATLEHMRSQGVKALYGRWLIEGAPKVLLFDTGSQYGRLDEWKADLWNLAGIPSPPNDHETNETIVFGYLVAWFLGEVRYLSSLAYASLFLIGILFFPVRIAPAHHSSHRTFSRVASGSSHPALQEKTY